MAHIKTSLVIGLGIGRLYVAALVKLGSKVYTVDTDLSKNADYSSVSNAISAHLKSGFDTVHICTPNFTHEDIARQVAYYAKIVFIEKPGLQTEEHMQKLQQDYCQTKFLMVKNNMWRNNIEDMRVNAKLATSIQLAWINEDRVPYPGSWFTTKKLAYGGVSRDLMPHLLSLLAALFPESYKSALMIRNCKVRNYSLSDLSSTGYGEIKSDGIYDVDDSAEMEFHLGEDTCVDISSSWKDPDRVNAGDVNRVTINTEAEIFIYDLGLCPEYAYEMMIIDCFDNLHNDVFWKNQYEIDLWIHRMVTEL